MVCYEVHPFIATRGSTAISISCEREESVRLIGVVVFLCDRVYLAGVYEGVIFVWDTGFKSFKVRVLDMPVLPE